MQDIVVKYILKDKRLPEIQNTVFKGFARRMYTDWHALFVLTGEEERVKQRLQYRFQDQFRFIVPKRKIRERRGGNWFMRTRVLFPGYVIMEGKLDAEAYYRMKNVPGILRLLRTGADFVTIRENEVQVLSRLVCNGDEIGISMALMENDQVRIIDGPLCSMEGIIQQINTRKGRVKVRLSFLGEERSVELGIAFVNAI